MDKAQPLAKFLEPGLYHIYRRFRSKSYLLLRICSFFPLLCHLAKLSEIVYTICGH
jgi:hypothetical protein